MNDKQSDKAYGMGKCTELRNDQKGTKQCFIGYRLGSVQDLLYFGEVICLFPASLLVLTVVLELKKRKK